MYHRGTLEQFNTWHAAVKLVYPIPAEGIVGYVNGRLASENQHTTAYVDPIQNPNGSDDYIWKYGAYPDNALQVVNEMWAVE
tara:strand:+ start:1224 stop:1469 length:246 start_codon:yes stop_codon:yes gene_type:complete